MMNKYKAQSQTHLTLYFHYIGYMDFFVAIPYNVKLFFSYFEWKLATQLEEQPKIKGQSFFCTCHKEIRKDCSSSECQKRAAEPALHTPVWNVCVYARNETC